MSLSPRLLLVKALHLLDRGEVGHGEVVLRDAIASAGESADSVTTVSALCCLGELLIQQERRPEAVDILQSCLAVPVPDDLGDVCAAERATAQRLLTALA